MLECVDYNKYLIPAKAESGSSLLHQLLHVVFCVFRNGGPQICCSWSPQVVYFCAGAEGSCHSSQVTFALVSTSEFNIASNVMLMQVQKMARDPFSTFMFVPL